MNKLKNLKMFFMPFVLGGICFLYAFLHIVPVFAAENVNETVTATSHIHSDALNERLLSAVQNDVDMVDVSDLNIRFDLENGKHILSDFQDEFMFQYAEDTFVIQNMTFTQQNGHLLSIRIHYADDVAVRNQQRTVLKKEIDGIIADVRDITDEKKRADKIAKAVLVNHRLDWFYLAPHGSDVYGALINNNSTTGLELAFHACMRRLGYEEEFLWNPYSTAVYIKTKAGDTWKYTSVRSRSEYNSSRYVFADIADYGSFQSTENNPIIYTNDPLTETQYTPISLFSDNPYLNTENQNAKYIRDNIAAGNTSFVLPETIQTSYRDIYSISNWAYALEFAYPEIGILCKTNPFNIKNQNGEVSVLSVQYKESDPEQRKLLLQEYYDAREKILQKTNLVQTNQAKIVMVCNYLFKTTKYIGNQVHSHDAYGCLVEKQCVCEGTASAFHDIMRELGITDYFVRPTGHIYNKVLLDGMLYMVDITANKGIPDILRYYIGDNASQDIAPQHNFTLFTLNDTLSMKSDATQYLLSQIERGNMTISTVHLDFYLDEDARKNEDENWYTQTLLRTYPVETFNVDTIVLHSENGKINSVSVTYKDRSETDIDAFRQYTDEIISKALQKPTEKELFASVIKDVYSKAIETSENTDIVTCAIENHGSKETIARLAAYIFEKIGVRFSVLKGYTDWYIKTVIDGQEQYGVLGKGRVALKGMDGGTYTSWYYSYADDHPIYELFEDIYAFIPRQSLPERENEYLDDWYTAPLHSAVLFGDANMDAKVDSDDAMLILQYYIGNVLSNHINLVNADVNQDKLVDSDDAMIILQYYAGLIASLPIR